MSLCDACQRQADEPLTSGGWTLCPACWNRQHGNDGNDGNERDALRARVAQLEGALRTMLALEERRMYERDMDDDAKVQPCPCSGCDGMRAVLARDEGVP